jgi:hypothetical protein
LCLIDINMQVAHLQSLTPLSGETKWKIPEKNILQDSGPHYHRVPAGLMRCYPRRKPHLHIREVEVALLASLSGLDEISKLKDGYILGPSFTHLPQSLVTLVS